MQIRARASRPRGYRGAVSPRSRVVALTAAAATVAAVLVVGIAALQSDTPQGVVAGPKRQAGAPPLTLELGVRGDAEAVALRRAGELYKGGRRRAAGRAFARFDSLEARVGQAFAAWPDDTVDRLNRLAGLHPQKAVVQLNLGVALFWSGLAGSEDAWRAAVSSEPDSPYAVAAANLLHPEYARGIPIFVTTVPLPADLETLTPAAQLERLRRGAQTSVDGKLLYGVALQRLGRQLSARRVFAAAARQAPANVEAQVAAAVGRFDKARPADAFSRLGPLTRRFPGRATVRFHLGLLLLWSGEVREAKAQLAHATRAEPGSPLAREADRYLEELRKAGV
jgi:tetratricopeptide (TPR) repeat protein